MNPKPRSIELPQPFSERIRDQFPDEYPEFLSALDTPPVTSIRLHPFKWPRLVRQSNLNSEPADTVKHFLGTDAYPVLWADNGWFLKDRPSFTGDPLFHAGCYYVQEASSMILEYVLGQPELRKDNEVILDACAAPGGKSTLIAAMFPDALVVANEVIRSRVSTLLENCTKWGTGNLMVTQNEISGFKVMESFFDLAVVDAPCSGEGLFRKSTASREQWSSENAHHCSLRQRTILMDTWNAIKPGGHLIYTTCTFNPGENEHNVAWLLKQTGGECRTIPFSPAPPDHAADISNAVPSIGTLKFSRTGPGEMITEIREGPVTGYGMYPHRSPGEGFFISVIRKPSRSGEFQANRPFCRAKHLSDPDAAAIKKLDGWFTSESGFRYFQIQDRLYRIRENHWDALNVLSSQLHVRYAGTEVAGIIRDDVRPAAAAALDMHLNSDHFPQIQCSRTDAIRFLRRENISIPESADTGWNLASFHGMPLGWLKHIGRRMNNYYPKEWRIRQI